jgi:hypothetical protein
MGTTLNGTTPATTYDALIKVGDNGPIDGTLKTLSDGLGNDLPMQASSTVVNFTNGLQQGGTAVPTAAEVASKQATLVSGTNIKTINSTSLLGSGDIAISASPAGVAGAIQFSDGSAFASDAANLFWDDTNNRLGIGTNNPYAATFHVKGVNTSVGSNAVFVENSIGLPALIVRNNGTVNLPGNLFAEADITVGNGNTSLGARVGIKGSGTTSATTSLLVQNSAGSTALQVRDDLRIIIPKVFETGEANGFTFNSNVMTPKINGFLSLDRTSNREFRIIDTTLTRNYLILQTSSSSNFADISFNTDHLAIKKEGNIGIGTSTPSAKTHIKGSGTTFATTALLVEDSAGTDLLKIRDDGQITCAGAIQAAGFVGTAYGNFGSQSYDPSVVLGAQSTSAGFLPPRMTTTQKNAISTPASGLMVYDTTLNQMSYYNGTTWVNI